MRGLALDEQEFIASYERNKAQPERGLTTPAGEDVVSPLLSYRQASPFKPVSFPKVDMWV